MRPTVRVHFSLKWLFIAVALISCCFAWLGNAYLKSRHQALAVSEALTAGAAPYYDFEVKRVNCGPFFHIGYEFETSPAGGFKRYFFGNDMTGTVVWLDATSEIRGSEINRLDGFPKLSVLVLDRRKLSAQNVRDIAQMERLEVLSVRGTNWKDDDLKQIGRLRRLHFLNIGGSQVSDIGMKHVLNLPSLETISIAVTRVTGDGLNTLSKCRTLKRIMLARWRIEDDAIERFRASRPDVDVVVMEDQ